MCTMDEAMERARVAVMERSADIRDEEPRKCVFSFGFEGLMTDDDAAMLAQELRARGLHGTMRRVRSNG